MTRTKKILLVGSTAAMFEGNRGLLDRDDIVVIPAATGADAIDIHRRERVQVIVADLDAADMGGDRLCTIVRGDEALRSVSIVLVCHDAPGELERVTLCGANAWVTRPVNPERLMLCVGQLLAVAMRKGYRVLLRAKVHGEHESESFFCTSHNISNSGILIETDKVLNEGDRITCSFFLPGARHIIADGETVRRVKMPDSSCQYGVRFVGLAPEFRTEIERFVASIYRE